MKSKMDTDSPFKYIPKEEILILQKDPSQNVLYRVKSTEGEYWMKVSNKNIDFFSIENGKKKLVVSKPWVNKDKSTEVDRQTILSWICTQSPDVSKLNYLFTDDCSIRQIIVKGYVQSGKTGFMLCSAMRYMFGPTSRSSIIVLRDSIGDMNQIKGRLEDMQERLSAYLHENHIEGNVEISILGDKPDKKDFYTAMSGVTPKIFVLLGNEAQIRRLNKMLSKMDKSKFSLFIDEADSNDSGENIRSTELNSLKEKATIIYYISATILEIGFREQIDKGGVYMLDEVPHYMGLDKTTQRYLPHDSQPCNKKEDIPEVMDPNIPEFLEHFSTLAPNHVDIFDVNHPQYCLMSCGSVIDPQRRLFKMVAETQKIAVLLYNGDGVDLYHPSIKEESIRISYLNGKHVYSSKCEWCQGAYNFNNKVGISSVIQWLKDNGGVERFPRIIVVSGRLAGRGISFTSRDYGKYLNSFKDGRIPEWMGWRLTGMYYTPSRYTNQPNLIQGAGRVCCIVRDNMPTYVYTNKEVFSDIRKAYWTQEELITRARKLQDEGGDEMCLGDAIDKITMRREKLSKRSLTLQEVKRLPKANVVMGEDGGFKMKDTYNNYTEDSDRDTWERSFDFDFKPEVNEEDLPDELSMHEFTRLTEKMFATWAKPYTETKISRFMKDLDPDKVFTAEEFKAFCDEHQILINLVTNIRVGTKEYGHGFGTIIRKNKEDVTYQLYPELVDSFKHYFNYQ